MGLEIESFLGNPNISGTDCRENVKTCLFLNQIMAVFYSMGFPCVDKTSRAQIIFVSLHRDSLPH